MRPDLVLTYRHCAFTAKPSYVGVEIAQGVAISARQQLGLEDGARLAVDLDMLTSVRRQKEWDSWGGYRREALAHRG